MRKAATESLTSPPFSLLQRCEAGEERREKREERESVGAQHSQSMGPTSEAQDLGIFTFNFLTSCIINPKDSILLHIRVIWKVKLM